MAKRVKPKPASRKPKAAPARRKAVSVPSQNFGHPKIPLSWHKDFQLVRDFRLGHRGKWPSRDSKNPTEVRLANWIRSNLELLTADRLPPDQARMINELVSRTSETITKRK